MSELRTTFESSCSSPATVIGPTVAIFPGRAVSRTAARLAAVSTTTAESTAASA